MNSFLTSILNSGMKPEAVLAAVVPQLAQPSKTASGVTPATAIPAIKAGVASAVINVEQARVAADAATPGSAISGAAAKVEAIKQFMAFLPMIEMFLAMSGHKIADPQKLEQGISGMIDGIVTELYSYSLITQAFAPAAPPA